MKSFRITFHNGHVQFIRAERWNRIDHRVLFTIHGAESISFPAGDLLMIDEGEPGVDGEDSSAGSAA